MSENAASTRESSMSRVTRAVGRSSRADRSVRRDCTVSIRSQSSTEGPTEGPALPYRGKLASRERRDRSHRQARSGQGRIVDSEWSGDLGLGPAAAPREREGRDEGERGEERDAARHPTMVPQSAATDGKGGGDEGTRTPDPRDANAVLSQLSYIPEAPRAALAGALASIPSGSIR